MDKSAFYEAIDGQDFPSEGPHGWIQWKGTNVCIDLQCKCGHQGHVDAEFFYHYRCPICKASYAVGKVVKLIELTPEQAAHVDGGNGVPFVTDEPDDEDVAQEG